MNILTELQAFDGKHTDVLEHLASLLPPEASVIQTLSEIAESEDLKLQTAATWLLKKFQGTGASFSELQVTGFVRLLEQMTGWEAKLHLLQMLSGLGIPTQCKASLYRLLKEYLTADKKLVRAWAYNGLFVLAEQHPEYRPEVSQLLSMAQQDESASVKARLRNMLKVAKWVELA